MKNEIKILPDDTESCKKLFENANDLIQGVDENGRFLYVNKKWRDTLGYTDKEILKIAFPDIIHQNHLQECFVLFAEMKKGKSFDNLRMQFVAKNGRVIDVDGNVSAHMRDGKFVSTWGIFREVVPRTKVEEALRQEQKFSQALIDSLPSVFYVFEVPSLRLVRWNRSLIDVFGYSNEETVKMNLIDFIDEQDKKKIGKLIEKIIASGKDMSDAHVLAKDGSRIPYLFSAVHAVIENKKYIVGMGIDITDLRKREEELALAKIALKNRDEQITKEQELNQAKSEFVSLASHQLKTPLTIIKWYINMLNAGYAGLNFGGEKASRKSKQYDKKKEYLGKIYANTQRMIELVNALLDVSRIELGNFFTEKSPVSVIEMADSVLDELQLNIENKKIKLKKEYRPGLPAIFTDPRLFRIIFQNLISNAIKYVSESGKVRIVLDNNEEFLNIIISDNGCGIPKKDQPKIFSKLFRAENVKKMDPNGTGLGLYLVRSVVSQLGGKIWFLSEEGNGAEFYIKIPFKNLKK